MLRAAAVLAFVLCVEPLYAGQPSGTRVLPEGETLNDSRLSPPKDLNGYFPMEVPATRQAWQARAEELKRQTLVACGLWPMPPRPEIKAAMHGKVDRDDYTVERVYFESSPGLYVTGSLYRPKGKQGPYPAVLCPHGHWSNGRFHDHGEAGVKKELAAGAEKFSVGGRHPLQARCVQLARLGCVVFHYDMLGYADSVPINFQTAHRFGTQREHLNRSARWGLYTPQAEQRSVNILGLQTWNGIRALDWVSSLPDIDRDRLAVTGASGGGTQSFMLAAVDDRIDAAFPAVMVSTAMQGGCTCENACYLRVNTGNIELAALCAPRPLGLSAANDWTKEIETKGLPELKKLYALLGVPDHVTGKHFDFPHNYNAVSRAMMYGFFNRHFNLTKQPIVESDFKPLTKDELTVWTADHKKPPDDEDAEVRAVSEFYKAAKKPLDELWQVSDKKSLAQLKEVVGGGFATMIGRELPAENEVETKKILEREHEGYREFRSLLRYTPKGEEFPVIMLLPQNWNRKVTIVLHGEGKAAFFNAKGEPAEAMKTLLNSGTAVATADLFRQGEFLKAGETVSEWRRVANKRQFAGYTLGYNHPLFARRVHDIMTMVAFAKHHKAQPESIAIMGVHGAGPLTAAAAVACGDAVSRVAVDTAGFRFDNISKIRDPMLWPGAVKFGDVPGLLALAAPTTLAITGEGGKLPEQVKHTYKAASASESVTSIESPEKEVTAKLAAWIAK